MTVLEGSACKTNWVAKFTSAAIKTITLIMFLFCSQSPGYSAEMKKESLDGYEFPNGSEWQKLINEGIFKI